MSKLSEFVAGHRSRFVNKQNNIFAVSWRKVFRRLEFLNLITERYTLTSTDFALSQTELQRTFKPGESLISTEQQELIDQGMKFQTELHMLIESSYLFSKIILDDVARAIEYYFGAVDKFSLDSHDDLSKKIENYARQKNLILTPELLSMIRDLKTRICDFRDYQIAHEKSPRTLVGTTWSSNGVRLSINRLYPKESDEQVDSEAPDRIYAALETYLDRITEFLEMNESKTNLPLENQDEHLDLLK